MDHRFQERSSKTELAVIEMLIMEYSLHISDLRKYEIVIIQIAG